MSADPPTLDSLPLDPAFPPSTYERLARLLEITVVIYFILIVIGFIARISEDWSMTIQQSIHKEPRSWYWTPEAYFSNLFAFNPSAVVLLGVAIMMVAVIGRSVISANGLLRNREWILGAITIGVIAMIAFAFLAARYA